MYLSNRDVRPTGYEAGEFIEPSTFTPPPDPQPRAPEVDHEDARVFRARQEEAQS